MSSGTPDLRAGARPARRSVVEVYDTTLRDGTQREGLSLSCDDKLRIAERLDAFGVAYIEAGWPGSNPKDAEMFERARDMQWSHAEIAAFGSTRRAKLAVEDDPQLATLLAAGTSVCTIFGKTWTMQVTEVLRTTLDENLRMIEESVAYLRAQGRHVIYDAEHFFDGYKADAAYAMEAIRAAARGGAATLSLCDTNGGSMPWEVDAIVREVRAALDADEQTRDVELGAHVHNDGECAVANSLAALRAGARHVQGTINGYGERCGNANLCSIVADAELKLGLSCLPEGKLAELYDLSHFVAEVANLQADDHAAYVGRSAFAHKGGTHVAAIRRHPAAYQHIDPAQVGNQCRIVVSELSGRGNVLSKAEELGLDVTAEQGAHLLEMIKRAEAAGFAYEAAEASVALLMAREDPDYAPPFDVIDFQASVGRRRGGEMFSEATVKVRVGGEVVHTAGDGNGPVSALDQALRKALRATFPRIDEIHLADYKVRILDGGNGTSATTRVLIDSASGQDAWSTVGASSNIIEASLQALVDGIEYGLSLFDGGGRPATAPPRLSHEDPTARDAERAR
ncbi:MAG: citramalate synthase [Myxococcales bacterium]|nr:citramalate synthase [Myxococcales bacterium]